MKIINLTPHPIRIYRADTADRINDLTDGLTRIIPASGTVARLATIDLGTWEIFSGVPIEGVEYGHAHNLPEPAEDTRYVVSLALALAHRRDDLLVPYGEVRNGDGTVVGCRVLARVAG